MTPDMPRPTPHMMRPRIRAVPPAASMPQRRHAFSAEVPRRGWPHALVFADTGVLLSVARKRTCIPRIAAHYADRLRVAETVVMEVERMAAPGAVVWADGRLHSAAATAKASMLDAGMCAVDPDDDYDSKVFDEVLRKLRSLPTRDDKTVHPRAHLGEAASIALCIRRAEEGNVVVFLVNDGGASLVAAAHKVPARHFGQVLAELVCAGRYSGEEAFEAFTFADSLTGVPADAAPADAKALDCLRDGTACHPCDATER